MADTQKKYLDNTGLAKLIALINGKFETQANVAALVALVGAAAKGDEDAKTVLERIAALEALAGEESVADQIEAAVSAEAEIARVAEKANADAIALLNDTADKAGSVAAAVKAEADRVDAKIGEVGDGTVKAYVDAAIEAVNGDAEELEGRVDDLEAAVDVINGEADGSIKKAAADALQSAKDYTDAAEARLLGSDELAESLDSIKDIVDYISKADDKDGVTNLFEMVTANGAAITAEEEARKAQIGTIPATVGETATTTVVAYVDAKVAALNSALVPLTEEEIIAAFGA